MLSVNLNLVFNVNICNDFPLHSKGIYSNDFPKKI